MTEANCLILFAKTPVHGKVKTRLAATLGHDLALALYRRMLRRQIALVNSMPHTPRQLWLDGDPSHPDLDAFEGTRHSQSGSDIGQRMCSALSRALGSFSSVVLIGCDCPGIDRVYLETAFQILATGTDAVFGPATDGGYVLVGLRRCTPDLFKNVAWGTSQVMSQTRKHLLAAGYSWKELEPLADIDEPGDLEKQSALIAREYGFSLRAAH